MNNHTGTKAKLKEWVKCRQCCRAFHNTESKIEIVCECGKRIDTRDKSGQFAKYLAKHPEKAAARLAQAKEYDNANKRIRGKAMRERVRLTNFNIVSGNNPICENCGCSDVRLLEINHKNGGGTKERAKGKSSNEFAWNIYMGRRSVDDLNLLCKVCNALHALEMKFGKLPIRVIYES